VLASPCTGAFPVCLVHWEHMLCKLHDGVWLLAQLGLVSCAGHYDSPLIHNALCTTQSSQVQRQAKPLSA